MAAPGARGAAQQRVLDRLADRARALWRGDWLAAGPPLQRRRTRAFAPILPSHRLYTALLMLLIGGAVLSWRYRGEPYLQELGLNLATDAFSIIVTVAIVQRFLERQDRARRLRGAVGAMRKARRALMELSTAWAQLIRSAVRAGAAALPSELESLFAPERTERLMYAGEASPSEVRHATQRLLRAQQDLGDVVRAYGATLDPIYIEAIDALADDPFPSFVAALDGDAEGQQQEWRARMNVARGARITHFDRLLNVIHLQNDFAYEAGRLRAKEFGRSTDVLGISESADHDLRVPLRIAPPPLSDTANHP